MSCCIPSVQLNVRFGILVYKDALTYELEERIKLEAVAAEV
jgi:hypothetical protein